MEQILNLLENLDFAINSTIDLKGLKVLLRKQQQVHEEFNEMKQNFEDLLKDAPEGDKSE